MYAAKSGSWPCIELLLPLSDVTAVNSRGHGPDIFASSTGDLALTEFLRAAALHATLRAHTTASASSSSAPSADATASSAAAGSGSSSSSVSSRVDELERRAERTRQIASQNAASPHAQTVQRTKLAELTLGPLSTALGVKVGRFGASSSAKLALRGKVRADAKARAAEHAATIDPSIIVPPAPTPAPKALNLAQPPSTAPSRRAPPPNPFATPKPRFRKE
jgi:hypothetical protein